ncbi:MAG: Uma2 family endonuclease [Gemmataceae bacterium]|nr:Uma2 family endonuclease [Gemmataceae bacterium]
MVVKLAKYRTFADVLHRVGNVPAARIRLHPTPGTAKVSDVTRIQDHEGIICELVDGILLEKTMGMRESILAVFLSKLLDNFVRPANLGLVLGPDATMQIVLKLVRIPDVSFIRWDRFPDRRVPDEAVPLVVPNLAAEVLSKSNTRREMKIKREEYFAAGVELVWEVDPRKRIVVVHTALDESHTLAEDDTLDGGAVLPGFQLKLTTLFGELDRRG